MFLIKKTNLQLIFCDSQESFYPRSFYTIKNDQEFLNHPIFATAFADKKPEGLVVLDQTHSALGYIVDQSFLESYQPYKIQGDYTTTNLLNTGLAVATADCLPIVLYDKKNNALGVVHAGWRGSVDHIVLRAIDTMQKKYGTHIKKLNIFFGPSSKPCCYTVQENFRENFKDTFKNNTPTEVFSYKSNKNIKELVFDLPLYNKLQLSEYGITPEQINTDYNLCTLCNTQFCSYRRDKENSKRQLTIAFLTN